MDKLHAAVASSSHTHFFGRKGLTFPNPSGPIWKLKGHLNHRPAKRQETETLGIIHFIQLLIYNI